MLGSTRKAVTVFDEFDAWTLIKPFSDEYLKFLIVVHEDAYGEFTGTLTPIDELKKKFGGSEEEFQEMLKQL